MTSTRFINFIPFIWKWECVRDRKGNVIAEDDPDDPGGLTKWGVDQRSHPKVDIRRLTEAQAREIYWKEYWEKNHCGDYNPGLGEVHFNACVNCGPGRAAKFIAACGGSWSRYLEEQESFYRRLANHRPKSAKYLKGWLNRTADLRESVAKLL